MKSSVPDTDVGGVLVYCLSQNAANALFLDYILKASIKMSVFYYGVAVIGAYRYNRGTWGYPGAGRAYVSK